MSQLAPVMTCYLQAIDKTRAPIVSDVETQGLIVEMGSLLRTAKNITKRIKMARPSGSFADPDFGLVNPPRDVADQMAALYFQSFESTYRILHIPTFWAEYKRYWGHPESASTSLRLKILLVIGIGSSLHNEKNPDADIRIMVHQWVQAAQTWLSGPLKKDRLDLSALQIYCLTILARQIFSIGGDLVWMSMGSLVHRAMQIGLHRDPKYLPPMSLLQAEIRRRLWATILELLVQSSLDTAMPPRISLDEFDAEPPSNIDDSDLDELATVLQSQPKSAFTGTSMQLLLLESLSSRLQILRLLHGLNSEISYLDVIKLTSDIMDICRASDSFLANSESHGATQFHRNLVGFMLRRFVLTLHCPFAVKARNNPLFYYSTKTTIDVSMELVSPAPNEQWTRLMTIGGGMFREGIRCAGSIISYELIAEVEAQRRDGKPHRNSQHIATLKEAVAGMIDFSEERIRQGETNIKGPMFLSQILAYVETIQAGTPSELRIAQSGRDSLEYAVQVLQSRADAISLPYCDGLGLTPGDLSEYGSNDLEFDLDFFLGDVDYC